MKKRSCMTLLLGLLICLTGCGGNTGSTGESKPEEVTQAEIAEETEPLTNAPFPETDVNAVTFDEIGADIATLVADDDTTVDGTLTIAEIDGNHLLKLTDNTTTADNLETAVQKIRFDVTRLLAPEQLEQVNSITLDVYAEAKDAVFVNDDGESMRVPGWIGGGGGTETCDGKWYGFADFSASGINEYNLERSDACHVTFKFLLAASGRKWDAEMTEPYFQLMRWGMQNISDLYIDNIVFLDDAGNSIPLTLSDGWAGGSGDEQEETVTTGNSLED